MNNWSLRLFDEIKALEYWMNFIIKISIKSQLLKLTFKIKLETEAKSWSLFILLFFYISSLIKRVASLENHTIAVMDKLDQRLDEMNSRILSQENIIKNITNTILNMQEDVKKIKRMNFKSKVLKPN